MLRASSRLKLGARRSRQPLAKIRAAVVAIAGIVALLIVKPLIVAPKTLSTTFMKHHLGFSSLISLKASRICAPLRLEIIRGDCCLRVRNLLNQT